MLPLLYTGAAVSAGALAPLVALQPLGSTQAQRAQQPDGLGLLLRRQRRDGAPHGVRVRRENALDEAPTGGGERQQNDATGGPPIPSPHQPPPDEPVHDVPGARRLDQDASLHPPPPELPPLGQH